MKTPFDAIVIGGGSGGLAFAKEAADRGASVLIVERERLGGTCVNRGCVPKKMMWCVADTMQMQASMADQGIFNQTALLALAKFTEIRAARINDIVESFSNAIKKAGITHVQGDAVVMSPKKVQIGATDYHCDKLVIATGARPSPLDIPGGDLMDISDNVFDWTTVPDHLVIIGGGYIGCEMAAIFKAFGSKVTLVSDSDAVLTEFSEGSQKIAAENLRASGVDICLNIKPAALAKSGNRILITLSDGEELQADRVLNATGRNANLEVFGNLEQPNQAKNGSLEIDQHFETSVPGIFAIGDVADRLPLTPVAREDGKTLAKQMFGAPETRQIDLKLVATTAFVLPAIGEVGETGTLENLTTFTALETLIAGDNRNEGWALQRNTDGGLSGVAIVGHAAAEAISWAGQTVRSNATREDMNNATSVHPSKAEEPLGSDD